MESLMFYHLPYNQPFFNYQLFPNQTKISSNFVLIENENKQPRTLLQDEKAQETKCNSESICKREKYQKAKILKNTSIRPKS